MTPLGTPALWKIVPANAGVILKEGNLIYLALKAHEEGEGPACYSLPESFCYFNSLQLEEMGVPLSWAANHVRSLV